MTDLRTWQRAFLEWWLHAAPQTALLEAVPGAGKTYTGLRAFAEARRLHGVKRAIINAPTRHIARQWCESARAMGFRATDRALPASEWVPNFDIRVTTYAQVANQPKAWIAPSRAAIVFNDEVHHLGDASTWGQASQVAFGQAQFVLSLSGTAFRSDNQAIPHVGYNADGESMPDFSYGRRPALTDEVLRPITFVRYGGSVQAGSHSAELAGNASRVDWALALRPETRWMDQMLLDADQMLTDLRRTHADAAGLIVAVDQDHARDICARLESLTGERAVLAVSDDPDASDRISTFRNGTQRWIVSVKMVSEGVDVPRLRVAVFLTNVLTRMFFTQFIGRVTRRARKEARPRMAYCYMPAHPVLEKYAFEIEEMQRHIVRDRPVDGRDEMPPVEVGSAVANVTPSEAPETGAAGSGKAIGLIVDREYRDLPLFGGALPQVVQQLAEEADPEPDPISEDVDELRSKVHALVSVVCYNKSMTHKEVYGRLKRMQGVGQATASAEQLQQRVEILRRWLN